MPETILQLKLLLDKIHPLQEDEWKSFSLIWKSQSAKRKEVITSAGEMEKYLYFVTEGVQRIYYFDELQREATIVFTYAPSFGGVLDSLMFQSPSAYYYETLTLSHFLKATYTDLQELMCNYPNIDRLIRVGITQAFSGVLERLVELQCFTAEERFKKLLQRSPHILQLVPHKYLANYLGIDATNFSKFINKIRI